MEKDGESAVNLAKMGIWRPVRPKDFSNNCNVINTLLSALQGKNLL